MWQLPYIAIPNRLYAHSGADVVPVKSQPATPLPLSVQLTGFLEKWRHRPRKTNSNSNAQIARQLSIVVYLCVKPRVSAIKCLVFIRFPLMRKPGKNGLSLYGGRTLQLAAIPASVAGISRRMMFVSQGPTQVGDC